MREDYYMTFWAVRDRVAVNVSNDFFKAAEAYAKQTGNLHDMMLFLCGA